MSRSMNDDMEVAGTVTSQLSDDEKVLLAREIAIDQHGYRNYGMRAFTDGWDAAMEWVKEQRQLTEDYYTLAEVRLAADLTIVEYGSVDQRLTTIAELIDKKRPELKPR